MIDKILPQDIQAEMSVLGAILINNQKIYETMELLTEDDFYKTAHRKIYLTMVELSIQDKAIDLITATNKLKEKKELSDIGGAIYLTTILNSVPTAENIKYYIDIVREKALLRRLAISSQKIQQLVYAGQEVREIVNQSQEIMFDCFKNEYGNEKRFYALSELLHDNFEYIENMQQQKGTGLKTGFTELNNIIGGLQNGELYIIAGDTSQGKSSLAMDIAYYIAEQKIPVAFFSIEMGKDNLIQRLICSRAKVDYMKMRSGYLSESDWVPLTTAAGNLSGVPLFINDFSTPTAIEITGMARKMVLYKGVKLVVIDFLQQIYHSDKKSETQQVTDDVKLIKGLAKSLNVPVILLSSLSRRTNFKEPPTLSLLRQSGAIESVADTVMFVYRQEEYSPTPENRGIAEIHIKKQRNGPTGVVTLAFIKQFTRFENLAYQKELTYDETL